MTYIEGHLAYMPTYIINIGVGEGLFKKNCQISALAPYNLYYLFKYNFYLLVSVAFRSKRMAVKWRKRTCTVLWVITVTVEATDDIKTVNSKRKTSNRTSMRTAHRSCSYNQGVISASPAKDAATGTAGIESPSL